MEERCRSEFKKSDKARLSSLVASPKIDRVHATDPQYPVEYIKDIVEHFRATEDKHLPNPNYMKRQTEIANRHRAILVDWLIGNHLKLKMHPETLYLAVNIIDRYLSVKNCPKSKLQLVGAVGLLIAAKYEEMYPPSVRRIAYLCANAYTRDEVLKTERAILNELNFELTVPTTFHFLRRATQVNGGDSRATAVANFVCEQALLEDRMLSFTPSVLAAGCVYVSNRLTANSDPWNSKLVHYTRLTGSQLRECAAELMRTVRTPSFPQCKNTQNKYAQYDLSSLVACAVEAESISL